MTPKRDDTNEVSSEKKSGNFAFCQKPRSRYASSLLLSTQLIPLDGFSTVLYDIKARKWKEKNERGDNNLHFKFSPSLKKKEKKRKGRAELLRKSVAEAVTRM